MDEQHEHIVDVSAGMDELTGILEWLARSVAERQFLELIRPSMELFDAIQHHIINEEDQFTPRRSASVRG